MQDVENNMILSEKEAEFIKLFRQQSEEKQKEIYNMVVESFNPNDESIEKERG